MSPPVYFHHESRPLRDGSSYDAIVVGGRAAGAATAMLLARAGQQVLLIDRGVFGTDTLSTHALMRGAVVQLARWGLLDEIVAAGTPAVRRTTFRYATRQLAIDIKPSRGVDALYAPRRTVLDTTLLRGAMEAGVHLLDRTSLMRPIRRGGRVAGIVAAGADGRYAEIFAPVVIGADGIRSTLARHVSARLVRRGLHQAASTYGYWSNLDTEGYEWVFRADACSGVIPTNDGQAVVFANATPARIGRGGVDTIVDVVREGHPELAERLGTATAPTAARTWVGNPGFLRAAAGPGWALVGDAGYFKDPISAHGLTDALRDAELVARAVIHGDGDAGTIDEALRDYESARDRLSLPLFDITDRIAAHDWSEAEIATLLMQLSDSMTAEVELLSSMDAEVAG